MVVAESVILLMIDGPIIHSPSRFFSAAHADEIQTLNQKISQLEETLEDSKVSMSQFCLFALSSFCAYNASILTTTDAGIIIIIINIALLRAISRDFNSICQAALNLALTENNELKTALEKMPADTEELQKRLEAEKVTRWKAR